MAIFNSATPFHQLPRWRRRNIKKAIKRKRRRYDAAFWGKVPISYETAVFLRMLTPEQGAGLNSGSIRDRKRVVRQLNSAILAMDALEPKPVPVESATASPLPRQTHEFIKKGTRWGLRRREVFKLW
jgi:hypothetical protein